MLKKHKGILLLFLAGLAILIYPLIAQHINNIIQKKQVNNYQEFVEDLTNEQIDAIIEQADKCNEEIYYNADGFRDPFGDQQEKLSAFNECLGVDLNKEFTDEDIFSALEIPKLKLVIPIYLGASEENLSRGIGQVEGSSLPLGGDSTHTVLAGHRGMGTKAMFRNIDELDDGDVFYIHTMHETLTYEVFRQKVIYPTQTNDLEVFENKDLATLLTCHPYRHNYQRLLIQAERRY